MSEEKRYGVPCRDIDVAMIVYNEAGIISESIAALTRRGFDSFVVLDMQSTDGTPDLLARLLGTKLQLFPFPRSSLLRHGYAEARNTCATHCQRPYVLFVDADEVLISGVEQGILEVIGGDDLRDIYTIERRNLTAASATAKTVGSVEHHKRLYMPRPAIRWAGYIHEEIAAVPTAQTTTGTSCAVFDHYSVLKTNTDISVKEGLYATMLLRAYNDPKVRPGMNQWFFDVHIPKHMDYLRTKADEYVAANDIDDRFDPAGAPAAKAESIAMTSSFFETFDAARAPQSLDLASVRTLHAVPARPWTAGDERALWCEWRHPGEGSRSLASMLQAFTHFNWPRFIRPGDTLIDIGAHSGDTAIPMALFGFDKERRVKTHVIAIEPNPAVRPVLAVNLEMNTHLAQFHLLSAAITREDTDAIELADHGNAECNGGVLKAGLSTDVEQKLAAVAGVTYTARGVSMATLFAAAKNESPAPIGFVKIDCEGYDKEIIRPCRELFAQDKPVLFVEWFDWFQPEDDEDLFSVIEAIGYVPFEPSTLKAARASDRVSDLLCVHRDDLFRRGLVR